MRAAREDERRTAAADGNALGFRWRRTTRWPTARWRRGAAPTPRLSRPSRRTLTLSSLVRETLRRGVAPVAIDDGAVGVLRFLFRREDVQRVADQACEAEGWATKKFVGTLLRGDRADVD